ncbi:LOW QUALITY PROTEIN: uncharacterized protein LOC142547992 [Primulina tabacum]|uniref:LOW QUALITY PROTEIN: uncharacterized protein LOC142547992 n=1 Tax=Primulina tabacum TaxID=48773 RepID=UPI003F59DEDC
MGSELCANGLEMEGTVSSNFIHNCVFPKADSPKVEEKNVRRFPESPNLTLDQRHTSTGRTVTPGSDRTRAERILDMPFQVTSVSSPPNVRCFDLIGNGSQTPKESIFDQFSPVLDKLMLAPSRQKMMEESRNNIVRRLSFSSTTNSVIRNQEARDYKISEEEQMFDIVYNDLLDVITSERTNGFASKSPSQVLDSDGFCTPKFAVRLAGIPETCPAAPKKSRSKYRNIDKNLRRKLEF